MFVDAGMLALQVSCNCRVCVNINTTRNLVYIAPICALKLRVCVRGNTMKAPVNVAIFVGSNRLLCPAEFVHVRADDMHLNEPSYKYKYYTHPRDKRVSYILRIYMLHLLKFMCAICFLGILEYTITSSGSSSSTWSQPRISFVSKFSQHSYKKENARFYGIAKMCSVPQNAGYAFFMQLLSRRAACELADGFEFQHTRN